MQFIPTRFFAAVSILILALAAGGTAARADGESIQIVNLTPTGAISPGTAISFTAAASGFTDPTYSLTDAFSGSGGTAGGLDRFGNFTWTPGVYDAGRHAFTVSANDRLGHSATTTLAILVTGNSIIPSAFSPGPIIAVGRTITFSLTAPGFISPNYYVYDTAYASTLDSRSVTSSTGAFSWAPTTDDIGTHTFTIAASDIYGHSAQIVEKLSVVNPVMSIQSLRPGTAANVGSTVSFVTSTPLSATTTYAVADSFTGTSTITASSLSNTGIFSWTPAESDIGMHHITVTATDAYGNTASTTQTLWISGAPDAAQGSPIVSTPSQSMTRAPAAPATAYVFTKYLAIGSRGTVVSELQKRLTVLGFYSGPVTGYFGRLTAAGVKKFQAAEGIAGTGNVGPLTRAALNR
ncbi:peptidoglycan-binding protein [Patescibacteria group bacterium]|nr:peptidoglycan-binding protein [Patescibacteria group bacterium]